MPNNTDNLEGEFLLANSQGTTTQQDFPPSQALPNQPPKAYSHPHPFTSYSYYPEGVSFEDQEENEEIILIVRRHFITNVPWLATALLLSLLPFTLFPFIGTLSPFMLPSEQLQTLILAFYFLGIFGFILLKFTLWYFNVGIVTNFRIRDININGLLYKNIAEAKLVSVQDVSYDQIGLIRSIFNYGDILIQTAANISNIEFDRAPRPATISRIISDLTT